MVDLYKKVFYILILGWFEMNNEPLDSIKADTKTEKILIGIEKFGVVVFSDLLLNELKDIEPSLSKEKYAKYIQ